MAYACLLSFAQHSRRRLQRLIYRAHDYEIAVWQTHSRKRDDWPDCPVYARDDCVAWPHCTKENGETRTSESRIASIPPLIPLKDSVIFISASLFCVAILMIF